VESPQPFRPGIEASEYPPIIQLLARKSPKRHHILVGTEPFQVKFAEQALGLKCQAVEKVDDATLLDGEAHLLCVPTGDAVDLSPGTREKASFWHIGAIKKGSAGAAALVRHAAALVGASPDKAVVQLVADELASGGIGDLRAAIWEAAWLLLGPPPEERKRWLEPWESGVGWLGKGVDPGYRLNTLLKDLTAYVFTACGEADSLKKAGIFLSPSKQRYLSGLRLDPAKVHATLRVISAWRAGRGDPWACALRVSAIWECGK